MSAPITLRDDGMLTADKGPLTDEERRYGADQLRKLQFSRGEFLSGLVLPGFLGAMIGGWVYRMAEAIFFPATDEQLPMWIAGAVGCASGVLLGWVLAKRIDATRFPWEREFLTEMLKPDRTFPRLQVEALQLACLRAGDPSNECTWVFARVDDSRILSVGGRGPICLPDYDVRCCPLFELVTWPERNTYVYFHALSASDSTAEEIVVSWWEPDWIPAGTLLQASWSELPALVQEHVNRNRSKLLYRE